MCPLLLLLLSAVRVICGLFVSSMCHRYDREVQSVRAGPHSHIWWGVVWVSRRLQLPAGWRLRPSLLHSSGWDKLSPQIEMNDALTVWSSACEALFSPLVFVAKDLTQNLLWNSVFDPQVILWMGKELESPCFWAMHLNSTSPRTDGSRKGKQGFMWITAEKKMNHVLV